MRWRTEPGLLQGWHHGTKAPTCPERWPSAAGSHALSSVFPDQGAGREEGVEKAVGPLFGTSASCPVLELNPATSPGP